MLARPVLLASAAAVGLLTLTACGGSSSSSESTSAAASPSATPSGTASGSIDSGANASGGGGGNADFEAYRSCLADNGVTLPEGGGPGGGGTPPSGMPSDFPTDGTMPSGGPGDGGTPPSGMPSSGPGNGQGGGFIPDGVDESTWEAAQQACASLAPTGGFGGGGGGQGGPADLTALQAYISCLSDHGVTVPEGEDPLRTLDRSDATVSAARDTCAPLLPQRGDDTSAAPSSS